MENQNHNLIDALRMYLSMLTLYFLTGKKHIASGCLYNHKGFWAGALEKWSCSKVRGFDPGAVYWMDIWTFFTLICSKNCIVCLKRGSGPFFKKGFVRLVTG